MATRVNEGSQQLQRSEPSRGLERPQPRRGGTSPFGLVSRMMEDMDRWFGVGGSNELFRGTFTPQIEVREREGKLVVHADLPGIKPEDVEVRVEDDVLTLSGERRSEQKDEREGSYYCERSYGRFERSIALPRGVDPNAIDAKFENGVLEISAPLPKEESRGRRIDVKSQPSPQTEPKKTAH